MISVTTSDSAIEISLELLQANMGDQRIRQHAQMTL